jgi:hypothetical protein
MSFGMGDDVKGRSLACYFPWWQDAELGVLRWVGSRYLVLRFSKIYFC